MLSTRSLSCNCPQRFPSRHGLSQPWVSSSSCSLPTAVKQAPRSPQVHRAPGPASSSPAFSSLAFPASTHLGWLLTGKPAVFPHLRLLASPVSSTCRLHLGPGHFLSPLLLSSWHLPQPHPHVAARESFQNYKVDYVPLLQGTFLGLPVAPRLNSSFLTQADHIL